MKKMTELEKKNMLKMLDAGMKVADVCEIMGIGYSTVEGYKHVLNKIRKGKDPGKNEIGKTGLKAVYDFLSVKMPEESKPEVKAEPEAKPEAKPEVKNDALYFIKLLEKTAEVSEHLVCLADADIPRATEKIVTAIEAIQNSGVDNAAICAELKAMSSIMAQTIREAITASMHDLINIEKENRNTLIAIKNSVQRMEKK